MYHLPCLNKTLLLKEVFNAPFTSLSLYATKFSLTVKISLNNVLPVWWMMLLAFFRLFGFLLSDYCGFVSQCFADF